jgi:hypothetical protein
MLKLNYLQHKEQQNFDPVKEINNILLLLHERIP